MKIELFENSAPSRLQEPLQRFEATFRYPLGPGRTFRIDHGQDYMSFYAALGESLCVVAENERRVVGVLSLAVRTLIAPSTRIKAAYVGDVKIEPTLVGARALPRLLLAATAWGRPRVSAAYAVVMEGGAKTPDQYSGRFGVPALSPIGRIMVYRIPCEVGGTGPSTSVPMSLPSGNEVRAEFGHASARSLHPPERIEVEGASAILEDTRRSKRLFDDQDQELRSLYLSEFTYDSPDAAQRLVLESAQRALRTSADHLFICVPDRQVVGFDEILDFPGIVRARAIIYGIGLPSNLDWIVNPAEI